MSATNSDFALYLQNYVNRVGVTLPFDLQEQKRQWCLITELMKYAEIARHCGDQKGYINHHTSDETEEVPFYNGARPICMCRPYPSSKEETLLWIKSAQNLGFVTVVTHSTKHKCSDEHGGGPQPLLWLFFKE